MPALHLTREQQRILTSFDDPPLTTPHAVAREILSAVGFDQMPAREQRWFRNEIKQAQQRFDAQCEEEQRKAEQERCASIEDRYKLTRHQMNRRF